MHGHTQLNNLVISTGGVMGPWVTQGDEKALRSSNHSLWNRCPFLCHPERTRISYFTALSSATYVVLPKENHMQLTEAATRDRKSGEAEGSAVFLRAYSHPLLRASRAASIRFAAPNLLIASDR